MYKNPGKRLKSIARFILWLSIILNTFLSLGAYSSSLIETGTKGNIVGVILFIVIGALIGALIGWLLSIFLYALGELIEDTHAMRKDLHRIEYRLAHMPTVQGSTEEANIEEDEAEEE